MYLYAKHNKLTFSQLAGQLLILLHAEPTHQPIYPYTWICALTV